MRDLAEIVAMNNEAIYTAYEKAIREWDWFRVAQIVQANPDLFPRRVR